MSFSNTYQAYDSNVMETLIFKCGYFDGFEYCVRCLGPVLMNHRVLFRINFLKRVLRSSVVIDPPKELVIQPVDGQWKITRLEVYEEQRIK